ncbi:hypothetical protein RSSM_03041 [Rhodopirellula sallentina SM41]|uniref:Uncharacterized protein n=1 Tax=Rhodopirellula sallentina SM41 TaxID=1263870 RepID=M5UCD1_9BACT|nr:hypothetical protein RSSM_03041 [Rhodopirellula sallentina SM41]
MARGDPACRCADGIRAVDARDKPNVSLRGRLSGWTMNLRRHRVSHDLPADRGVRRCAW